MRIAGHSRDIITYPIIKATVDKESVLRANSSMPRSLLPALINIIFARIEFIEIVILQKLGASVRQLSVPPRRDIEVEISSLFSSSHPSDSDFCSLLSREHVTPPLPRLRFSLSLPFIRSPCPELRRSTTPHRFNIDARYFARPLDTIIQLSR